jgi:hypothetical protein
MTINTALKNGKNQGRMFWSNPVILEVKALHSDEMVGGRDFVFDFSVICETIVGE